MFFLGLFLLLLVASTIIVLHEFGHFYFARSAGVEIKDFKVFFGPTILKKTINYKGNDTCFQLGCIPFGGYVRPVHSSFYDSEIEGSVGAMSHWQKTKFLFGGVLMNFISGWVALTALFYIGVPEQLQAVEFFDPQIVDSLGLFTAPLYALLIIIGAIILSVVGVVILFAVETWNLIEALSTFVVNLFRRILGHDVPLGREVFEEVIPAAPESIETNIYTFVIDLFANPVENLIWFLAVFALASILIGAINASPLPFLDGGQWLMITIFSVVKTRHAETIHGFLAGFGLLLFLFLIYADELVYMFS